MTKHNDEVNTSSRLSVHRDSTAADSMKVMRQFRFCPLEALKAEKLKGKKGERFPSASQTKAGLRAVMQMAASLKKKAQLQTKRVGLLKCFIKAVGVQPTAKQHASHTIPQVYLAPGNSSANLVLAQVHNNV